MKVSAREGRDLVIAWVALGFAFSLLYVRGITPTNMADVLVSDLFVAEFALSLATVGVAFLLH